MLHHLSLCNQFQFTLATASHLQQPLINYLLHSFPSRPVTHLVTTGHLNGALAIDFIATANNLQQPPTPGWGRHIFPPQTVFATFADWTLGLCDWPLTT